MFLQDPLFLFANFLRDLRDNSSLLRLRPQSECSLAEADCRPYRSQLHLSEVLVRHLRWFLSELRAPVQAHSDNRDLCLPSQTFDCQIFPICLGSKHANNI